MMQNVKLIRINYWVEKIESGIHFDGNIVHTDNQMRRARCWFPCIDDEYHRCRYSVLLRSNTVFISCLLRSKWVSQPV